MTDSELTLAGWLLRTALGGAAVLTLGRAALACAASPETRHRLASSALRAAALVPLLALLPAWWAVPLPSSSSPPVEATAEVAADPVEEPAAEAVELPAWSVPTEPDPAELLVPAVEDIPEVAGPPAAEPEPTPEPAAAPSLWPGVLSLVAAAYLAAAALFLAEFAVGLWALARLRRRSAPASARLSALAAGVVGRRASLRVTRWLGSPVCFGVLRPTVVLPEPLADRATADQLTWVLAHEAEHLRRGDPLTGWFAGVSKALYFFAPAFWAVRRELRLSQEHLADAAAVEAGGRAADYAEFLIDLTADPTLSRPTRLAHGVRARPTELTRRITMVLSTTPARRRGPALWATPAGAALVATAALLSGVAFVSADDKKPDGDKPAKARVIVVNGEPKKADGHAKKADEVKTVDGGGTPFMQVDVEAEGAAAPKTLIIRVTGKVADNESWPLFDKAVAAAKAGDTAKVEELLKELEKANPGVRAIVAATGDAKKADGKTLNRYDVWQVGPKLDLNALLPQKSLDRIAEARKSGDPAKLKAVLTEMEHEIAEAAKAKADDEAKPAGDAKKADGKAYLRVQRSRLSPEAMQKYMGRIAEAAKAGDAEKFQAVMEEFQKAMAAANSYRVYPAQPAAPRVPGVALPKSATEALEKAMKATDDPKAREALKAAMAAVERAAAEAAHATLDETTRDAIRKSAEEAHAAAAKRIEAAREALAQARPAAPPAPAAPATPRAHGVAPVPPAPPVPPVAGFRMPKPPIEALEKALEKIDDPKAREALKEAIEEMKKGPRFFALPAPAAPEAKFTPFSTLRVEGFSPQPMQFGFAVPAGVGQNFSHPPLGVMVSPVPEAVAAQLKLAQGKGALVVGVAPNSPFAKAGVAKNDVLMKLNGDEVDGPSDLVAKANKLAKGAEVTATVVSQGKEKAVTVTVPKPGKTKVTEPKAVEFRSVQIQENNGDITAEGKTEDVVVKLTAKRTGDGVEVGEITAYATEGGKAKAKVGQSADQFDAKYRPAVEALLKQVGGK